MNNIQGAVHALVQTDYVQSAMSIMTRLKALHDDPEFFEKVCQVAVASLQLVMMRYPGAANLSKLSFAMSTALMHDFYSFVKKPYQWLYPISLDHIDQNSTLQSLIDALQPQLDLQYQNEQELEDFAKKCLEHRFKEMDKVNSGYRSVDEFKAVLKEEIRAANNPLFVLTDVELDDFEVTLRHIPLGERLTTLTWMTADACLVGFFVNHWKLIDIASWAESIGEIPGFHWVKNSSFDTWSYGIVCTGFGLQLYEATRKLYDEALTEQDRRNAHWKVTTSVAELVYYGSIFMNRIGQTAIEQSSIYCLAIFAKSLGLISIATRPAPLFFQPKLAPAAA